LVSLCVLVGALGFVAAPAVAAPPKAPNLNVESRKATPVEEARLDGTLYPGASGEPGSYEFLYKQSASECVGGSKTASGLGTGMEGEQARETLTGLQSGKTYTACLSLTTAGGTALSEPVSFVAPIAVEAPTGLKAEAVAATTVTLHGVLNPGGERKAEPGSYEFLYKRSATGCEGESATPSTVAAGAREEAVSVPVAELVPRTTYAFCLRATNEVGEAMVSAPVTFVTPAGAPRVAPSVVDVASTSATLRATINPEASATTYTFEYAPAGGAFVPVAEVEGKGSLPEGTAGVPVSVRVQVGLVPGSEYQFRVVAVNSVGTTMSEPVSLVTQLAGTQFALPDGRQWELVSPPDKRGATLSSLAQIGPMQAAEDGSGITYQANVPTEAEPQGYVYRVQLLSMRGLSGWSTRDIATPHASMTGIEGFGYPEYLFFSSDLSSSLLDPIGSDRTLLSARASEPTQYLRSEAVCDTPSSPSECYLPLLTGKEGYADVPQGTVFGGKPGESNKVLFEGATPDLRHVLLESEPTLTNVPVPSFERGEGLTYEWSAGAPASEALQLISVLPASEGGGVPDVGTSAAGNPDGQNSGGRYAVSDDGSRVFWVTYGPGGEKRLFLRDTSRGQSTVGGHTIKGETIRLDVQQSGVTGGTPEAYFQVASTDGSKVFFIGYDQMQRLTAQSGHTGADLYECEVVEEAGKLACKLTDLTPESGGQSAEVQHLVVGASKDASYVYFVAQGVLGDGAQRGAKRGTCENSDIVPSSLTCNLYEYHNGTITFIAALSQWDSADWGYASIGSFTEHITARVSDNGRYLAFMSQRSLTGYDNRDAVTGKPAMEVYLYDAESKRLVCASCNPTGSRPVGAEVSKGGGLEQQQTAAVWVAGLGEPAVAASLPGASKLAIGGALYQPRALSDSGRLFFNAIDPLVPQAVDGNENVYEFEPAGVGSCTSAQAGFVARSGGCVSLISSGSSPEESGFLDASANGSDVFFLTSSRLVPGDYDTSYDVYDAHECSPSVPCVTAPVASPPCSSGDACKGAPAPQPAVFGEPASATFAGSGNVTVSAVQGGVVKSRSLTRSQELARALRVCKQKSPKRKRRACERQAHKQYRANARVKRSVVVARKARG
jgi:hypothetical protein